MKTEKTSAYIALNNNRIKINANNIVYLNDNNQFEIELFNAEDTEICAQIHINNELISKAGLILKPGQRYFLDRYIDTNYKFKFNTYEVENNASAQEAIKNNGKVSVHFFKKKVIPLWQVNNQYPWNGSLTHRGFATGHNGYNTLGLFDTTSINNDDAKYAANNIKSTTGRIESGDVSDQEFIRTNMVFEEIPFSTSTYTILPKEVQPTEVTKIRNYCTHCGARMRKQSWNYCPHCGMQVK